MNGRPWSPYDTATLYALHKTHADHEIARKTGHHTDTVQRRRAALGLDPYVRVRYSTFLELPAASWAAIRRVATIPLTS